MRFDVTRPIVGDCGQSFCAKKLRLKSKVLGEIPAVVAERSNASYLIGDLGMLKVEGSNPRHAETFFRFAHARTRTRMRNEKLIRLRMRTRSSV